MRNSAGFIFVFVLGILGIIIAFSFAMMVSARSAFASQRSTQGPILASLAADEGTDHALGVIRRQFDNGKAIPTQLNDAWRRHFWPIDAMSVRFDQAANLQKAALGESNSPEDIYENDVKVENGLMDPYARMRSSQAGYMDRTKAYNQGFQLHHGNARWYEPGVLTHDPVGKPLSFHLSHPQPKIVGHADPAISRNGENYSPDINAPMWYDSEFTATEDVAKRRYRLRYAVAIEDLGGHLLVSLPGAFDPAAKSVYTGGTPDDDSHAAAFEVNKALAERYAAANSNIFRYSHLVSYPKSLHNEIGDLAFRGVGTPLKALPFTTTMLDIDSENLLGKYEAGRLLRWCDYDSSKTPADLAAEGEPDLSINKRKVGSGSFAYLTQGPIASFRRLWWGHQHSNGNSFWLHLLYTPFGRSSEAVAAPTRWHESYVDNPWRLNLPTAAPRAVTVMVQAYMPAEYLTYFYQTLRKEQWTGGDTWGHPDPDAADVACPPGKPWVRRGAHRKLFVEMAGMADFAARGGVESSLPYPGTTESPTYDDADPLLGSWERTAGRDVLTSTAFTYDSSNKPGISLVGAYNDYSGNDGRYSSGFLTPGSLIQAVKAPTIPIPPDTTIGGRQTLTDSPRESYWEDMHVAILHAVALAQWAWTDQVTRGSITGPGVPQWPTLPAATPVPLGYFPATEAAEFTVGGVARDRDVDGDGIKDVPSTFDTIKEVDAQFLRNLGESPAEYATGTRPTVCVNGIRVRPGTAELPAMPDLVDLSGSKNIKAIKASGKTELAKLMELVVNDMRMSFFGASPSYPDFRPLDLDDDGIIRCSCFSNGTAASVIGTPMRRFSLTGYFDLQKSRYYRVMVRGEVFDEMRGTVVAQDNIETVYVVDPDGDVVNRQLVYTPAASRSTGMSDSHVLFQRHHRNRYLGLHSNIER